MTDTDKVKRLTPATAEPVKSLVEMCEDILAKAKSGELRSLVAAGSLTSNKFYTAIETHDSIETVGLLGVLQHRMARIATGD